MQSEILDPGVEPVSVHRARSWVNHPLKRAVDVVVEFLPDEVARALKVRAAKTDCSYYQIFIYALRRELDLPQR